MNTTISYPDLVAAHPDKEVAILQRLGWDVLGKPLVCDGLVGPKTRGALFLNPEVFLQAKSCADNAPCDATPHQVALFVQASMGLYVHPSALAAFDDLWAGEQETHGNNSGPYVSSLYEDPNPTAQQGAWCGVALRKWIRSAYPASLPVIRKSWMAKGVLSQLKKVAEADCRSGDGMVFHRKVDGTINNSFGHATLIVLRVDQVVYTIEGNVDLRPGVDGVACRRYRIDLGLVSGSGAPLSGIGRVIE